MTLTRRKYRLTSQRECVGQERNRGEKGGAPPQAQDCQGEQGVWQLLRLRLSDFHNPPSLLLLKDERIEGERQAGEGWGSTASVGRAAHHFPLLVASSSARSRISAAQQHRKPITRHTRLQRHTQSRKQTEEGASEEPSKRGNTSVSRVSTCRTCASVNASGSGFHNERGGGRKEGRGALLPKDRHDDASSHAAHLRTTSRYKKGGRSHDGCGEVSPALLSRSPAALYAPP